MPRRDPALGFEAIRIEGGLLTAEFLGTVVEEKAGQQTPESYRLRHGLEIRDEIGQAWRVAEAHWRDLEGAGLSRPNRERILLAMLNEAFGWSSVAPETSPRQVGDRRYPLTASGLGGKVPVVIGDHDVSLDEALERFGDDGRRRAAFGLVQEFLNADDESLWGVVTNGDLLRIVRDNSSLTRPAWIEADLQRIFTEQRYADFSLLWLLLHESRFGAVDTPAHDAILEQWRDKSLAQGIAARDRLRGGVEEALKKLGNGFLAHPRNNALREALTSGTLEATEFQRQLLRLVYRLIVLVVAEERELLHPPGSAEEAVRWYAKGYGIRRLRERAARRRAYDRHDDLWDALQVVFRGCATGEPRLALPGLGGLFAGHQCPDLDGASIRNSALLEAVYHLTWLDEKHARVRVNWRDMGTEELGSVYESLLELEPELRDGAREYGFVGGDGGGHARRLTGSYYTPDSLVQALLDSALDPVIERAVASDDPEAALLALSVIDPAMGSGHFLLGAARRIAGELARLRTDGTPGPESYRRALREVISHCIHGVDKNAMAVELARIALWLEAMEPGKPLAFLDHHLIHGDAILGILDPAVLDDGIPDDAFSALAGDDREVAKRLKANNKEARKLLARERKAGQVSFRFDQAGAAESQRELDAMPDDSLEAVAAKREAYEAHRREQAAQFRFLCDAYVAAFLLPKTAAGEAAVPHTGTLLNQAIGVAVPEVIRTAVAEIAEETPLLHWPIAFAGVMERGGFDCVVGNPPWEKIKLSEKEFFANRDEEIANAPNKAARQALIDALEASPPGTPGRRLFRLFQAAKRESDGGSNFVRNSGRFELTGTGDVNLYPLFAESSLGWMNRDGWTGLVLPLGIVAETTTATYFDALRRNHLVSFACFENEGMLIPGIHHSTKFGLLTCAGQRPDTKARFCYFLRTTAELGDERRWFSLSDSEFSLLSPITGNAPVFRSQEDLALNLKLYSQGATIGDPQCGWQVTLASMFHMSGDSEHFHRDPTNTMVPLYEPKMMFQYDHRYGSFESRTDGRGHPTLPPTLEQQYQNQEYEVSPWYWVEAADIESRLRNKWAWRWLVTFRRITSSNLERTVVAAALPRVGTGDALSLLCSAREPIPVSSACLLACFNSLVFDYIARQRIGGNNFSFYIVRQLPLPDPERLTTALVDAIVSRVIKLTYTTNALRDWAVDLGFTGPPQRWNSDERALLRAELDAIIGNLYGISRDEMRFVLDPSAVVGPGYPSETFRVLQASEMEQYGEYRTGRLVLEAWDRLIGTR